MNLNLYFQHSAMPNWYCSQMRKYLSINSHKYAIQIVILFYFVGFTILLNTWLFHVIKNEFGRWAWFARDSCILKPRHQYSLAFISWILNMKILYAASSISAVNKRLLPLITIIHIYISRYAYICYHLSIFNRSALTWLRQKINFVFP